MSNNDEASSTQWTSPTRMPENPSEDSLVPIFGASLQTAPRSEEMAFVPTAPRMHSLQALLNFLAEAVEVVIEDSLTSLNETEDVVPDTAKAPPEHGHKHQ
ncbi:MAG: hypothetical protein SGBAC_007440 [Bacillariaceae sp.]